MGMKNMFDGIEKEKVGFSGDYLIHGQYLIRIDEVKHYEGRKGDGVRISGVVVHAYRDGNGKRPTDEQYTGHNVGDEVSQVCPQRSDYFLKDVKSFIMAATGVPSEEVTPEDTMAVVGYELVEGGDPKYVGGEPLNGRFFTMECNNTIKVGKKLDDNGNPIEFSNVRWTRRVPSAEVITQVSESVVDRFYTNEGQNMLELLAGQGL